MPNAHAPNPFIDFREVLDGMDQSQKRAAVGASNYKLIESGRVQWEDVVTPYRVRDLREVVAIKKFSVHDLLDAGVKERYAVQAHASVHTPAHELAEQARQKLLDNLRSAGLSPDIIVRLGAQGIAQRVRIGEGPSGPSKPFTGPDFSPTGPLAMFLASFNKATPRKPKIVRAPEAAKPTIKPTATKERPLPTFGPSEARIDLDPDSEREILTTVKKVLGKNATPRDAATLAGAPDGTVASVWTNYGNVMVTAKGNGISIIREIERDMNGKLKIHNIEVFLDKDLQGAGRGTEILGRQIEAARKAGATRIYTTALRNDFERSTTGRGVGYEVWPKFGFDCPLPEETIANLPASLAGATRVSDLYGSAEGRAWWSKNGETLDMKFDLTPGSYSNKVWDAYLRAKQEAGEVRGARLHGAGTEAGRAGAGAGGKGGTGEEKPGIEIKKTTAGMTVAQHEAFQSVYAKAPAAKEEVDSLASRIARIADRGSSVIKAPVKSEGRALEKIRNDYQGDATRIKDLARNTILADKAQHDLIVEHLKQAGADIKVITATADPMGYSGVNATLLTQAGIRAEIQVNSAHMIYAKEPESLAKILLGEERWNAIAAETGLPGGLGHKFYEEYRSLPPGDPNLKRLETESRAYYDQIRSPGQIEVTRTVAGMSETKAPSDKLKPIRSEMVEARREGKGKEARIVMADGREAPPHVTPAMIPPAWSEVKVSVDPAAEVLVTARDQKGRPKMVTSKSFDARSATVKFSRIADMIDQHGTIAEEIQRLRTVPATREEADCAWLMQEQATRPGSDRDTKAKVKAYGATTLEARHVVETPEGVRLQFVGKEGIVHDHLIKNDKLGIMLLERKAAATSPESRIFATSDAKVRDFTATLDGGKFSPKDFRTSAGTRTAAELVKADPQPPRTEKEFKAKINEVATKVSRLLGNKPAQALESYIHPDVFTPWKLP
jgi:DNA topoisomerase IB/GNAT superfamily N-acetyltransferase